MTDDAYHQGGRIPSATSSAAARLALKRATLAIGAGATCAITDPMKYSLMVKAVDLLRGRDQGMKYLKYYRAHAPEKTA